MISFGTIVDQIWDMAGDIYAMRKAMPSKTPRQARTMAAAAHNPAFAKKVGIPPKVAKEFNAADKGKHFTKGKGKR